MELGSVSKADDEYETPASAWQLVTRYLPRGTRVWDPFYSQGVAGPLLRGLGMQVIHENRDFFRWSPPATAYDVIVTNPPFTAKKEILERLVALRKPFALLVPLHVISSKYFMEEFEDRPFQVIMPRKRIHFIRNGQQSHQSGIITVWVTHGMERFLPRRQIIYSEPLSPEQEAQIEAVQRQALGQDPAAAPKPRRRSTKKTAGGSAPPVFASPATPMPQGKLMRPVLRDFMQNLSLSEH